MCAAGCARKAASGPEPPVVYIAAPVQRDVSIHSAWIGTTVGYVDAEIHSQVTGYLLSQNYKEGSLVRRGDLLFQVDPRPFQALVDQAKARVDAAKTQLEQARAQVEQAKAEIDRAQANFGKSELDVKRYSPLVSDGTVSQQELDDAVQANLANKASVAAAQGQYKRAQTQVATADADVNVARSALQVAELNLGFTRVTAPVDGIAGIRVANIGDLVGTTDRSVLTSVSTLDPIFVEFSISEQEYLALRSSLLADDVESHATSGPDPRRRNHVPASRHDRHRRTSGQSDDRHAQDSRPRCESRQRPASRAVRQGACGDQRQTWRTSAAPGRHPTTPRDVSSDRRRAFQQVRDP